MSETSFDAVTEALREQLTDLLRRVRPRVIFCYVAGEKRKMDTGGGRGVRYAQLARVIVAMGTTLDRVDLCNHKGDLIESWHPRGAVVEDEPEPEPTAPTFPIPAGLAMLPAEMVGQVLTLAMSFGHAMVAAVQRATDHAVDKHTGGMRLTTNALVDIVKHERHRADAAEREAERIAARANREIERARMATLDAREVALDAKRVVEEDGIDPNSPDAMMASLLRTGFERAGMVPNGASAKGPAAPERSYTSKRDTDEN